MRTECNEGLAWFARWVCVALTAFLLHRSHPLLQLSCSYGSYKCSLRGQYVSKYEKEDECLKHKPDNIPRDQWVGIVSFWYSYEGMKRSARNTDIRKKQKFTHSCGRKSLARKTDEMKEELGRDPTRVEVFLAAHKRKDGSYMDEESAKIVEKFQEFMNQNVDSSEASQMEVFEQVMGREHSGRVRGMGLGPTPSEVFKTTHRRFARVEINSGTSMEDHETIEEGSRITKLESEVAEIRLNMKKVLSKLDQINCMQVDSASGTSLDDNSREDQGANASGNNEK